MTATSNQRASICVPVCVRRADDLAPAIERAARLADIIEIRFDCFADESQLASARRQFEARLLPHTRPLIVTFRPAEQGGSRALIKSQRSAFRDFHHRWLPADFSDIELDKVIAIERAEGLLEQSWTDWGRVICSHHDFVGVPADLEAIYERMTKTPARVLKIAVQADEITDCVPVVRLLGRARREGRELIGVAMGEAGLLTRVLAPAFGSFLTYGALDASSATAPGQISAAELRDLYRVHSITERTIVTGLVGSPVSHSLSPHMHNAAFAARSIDAVYVPFETRDARAFARRMARPTTRELAWNLRGFSVTAPHKSAIIETLDELDDAARGIGAVNTVLIEEGAMRGYNTDADAALAPLRGLIDLAGSRVAVVGAGGAARALLWSLRERGARATVFARDAARASKVAAHFGAQSQPLGGARFDGFDLVVNATPLGTRGERENESAATAEQLRGARVAYDLVYNPAETRFLREAREAGCESAVGGISMLVAQAAAQFELWTGERAPVDIMRSAAERKLSGMRD